MVYILLHRVWEGDHFLKGENDEIRIKVLEDNVDLWKDIEDEVKRWTLSNWSRWEVEKPEWFTEAFKEGVPDDMIPEEALAELNRKSAGGVRRRSKVGSARTPEPVVLELDASGGGTSNTVASVAEASNSGINVKENLERGEQRDIFSGAIVGLEE